ncbi:unnamed protein product [Arabis nemorensis]|uniref:Uncharacterized protein n=1 Tax=Arabis nemorensis TaxID=586526 RepID=A0A565BCL5_9BRAS|nr:unnamed protein product [Arabis nemorensis]
MENGKLIAATRAELESALSADSPNAQQLLKKLTVLRNNSKNNAPCSFGSKTEIVTLDFSTR